MPLFSRKRKGDVLFLNIYETKKKEEIFFQNTNYHFMVTKNQSNYGIILSDRSSHGTARSYSVGAFGIKKHFKSARN